MSSRVDKEVGTAVQALPVDAERARVIAIIKRVERWAKKNATRPLAWKACCDEIIPRIQEPK